MIQFNLLPDVKQEYQKSARMKRTVIVISFLIAASTLAVFIMLFMTVHVFQKVHLNALNTDITDYTKKINDTPDLNKVLTIQNQLNSLTSLHDQKPVASRLVGYLEEVTPAEVSIGKIDVDYALNTMIISGSSDALSTVNKFTDSLKFTTYTEKTAPDTIIKPFTNVVLASYTKEEKQTTYTINLVFDKAIFDTTKEIKLAVPKITSTRSDVEKPKKLFQGIIEPEANQ